VYIQPIRTVQAVLFAVPIMERSFSPKFVIWWSIIWAVAIVALAPIVNLITPFTDPTYNIQWTPDILYRLVLYFHGAFIPWITALAALVVVTFSLDQAGPKSTSRKILKDAVLIGGVIAVPLAGVAGIFNVYDKFLLGIPLWTQIFAFLIGDEMAIALIVALLVHPKASGMGYGKMGMPYYVVLLSVVAVLISAVMGHAAGWVASMGPWPSIIPQYINSTMYPVLGFYNNTSVITWTEDVVGSHSHLMIPALMAGIVGLIAVTFDYSSWPKKVRSLSVIGFVIMVVGLIGAVWMYVVSGVGNYAIPTLFESGPNGIAADDLMTGVIGIGAFVVLVALVIESVNLKTKDGITLLRDPLFLSLIAAWIFIFAVIPVTGMYIELNQSFYGAAGAAFDAAYTRFHQDYAFFLLPALVTGILIFQRFGISGGFRKTVGYLFLSGVVLAFVFGWVYSMVTLDVVALYLAIFGGGLMLLGGLVGAEYLRRTMSDKR
jgi:hypothetical protein